MQAAGPAARWHGDQFGDRAIGIVLSGTGSDGLDGARHIQQKGGLILVQDPATTNFTGMPTAIIEGDHPIAVEEPDKLADRILTLIKKRDTA